MQRLKAKAARLRSGTSTSRVSEYTQLRRDAMGKEKLSKPARPSSATEVFEQSLRKPGYVLRLYVSGTTPKSLRAIMNVKKICEENLKDRYDLQVIDIYQQPVLAKGEQIIAAPTLIKKLPLPLRKLIGDMSNVDRVLLGLDLRPEK
jgi:circadian clock protein KaiB